MEYNITIKSYPDTYLLDIHPPYNQPWDNHPLGQLPPRTTTPGQLPLRQLPSRSTTLVH